MVLNWIIGAVRRAFVLMFLCAFILAPTIIAATHGPGLTFASAQASETLLHGHSHNTPEPGEFGAAHDATDHEHQTQIVLPQNDGSVFVWAKLRLEASDISATGLPASGLRRPPKDLSA